MDANQTHSRPLELDPIEVSTPDDDAARTMGDGSSAPAAGQRELRITIADEFLTKVAKEYQEGHIDPALWARVSAQYGNDESLVIAAYLRARVSALQRRVRKKRSERRASRAASIQGASSRKAESETHPKIVSTKATGVERRGVKPKVEYVAAAAAALASAVAVAWVVALPQESEPVRQPNASTAAPSPQPSVAAGPLRSAQPVSKSARGGTNQDGPEPTLEAKVQQLKDDGNWNVLVLYASKWTREQPNNAVAWNELSIGYANLRQFNDALDAATKAVELSPGASLLWRNLGHLNLTVERLPEAATAFDRALAMRSDDEDALCGAALVAQKQGRAKDADAIAKQLKSTDGSCPGLSDGESVGVVAGGVAARKGVLSVVR